VLELAGLAPGTSPRLHSRKQQLTLLQGPFAGLLLADYGASVLRIDRPHSHAHSSTTPPAPTPDNLTRRKTSIALDLKSPRGIALLKTLLAHADILIDPFRPGVLEKLGLSPQDVLLKLNPKLIVARMSGFRRDGKYKDMAGHDINYIAVSGVLSMLGRKGEKPYAPGNILGDFAGGGGVCFMGILLALIARGVSGRGQVVEANMVDGSAFMASFPRLVRNGGSGMWDRERGRNVLDGGCPWYDTYETRDGGWMSVGALEPRFFKVLCEGLGLEVALPGPRENRETWPAWRELFAGRFKERTRAEWEGVFDGSDACCLPVLTQEELRSGGFGQRPVVGLRETPGLAVGMGEKEVAEDVKGQGEGVEGGGWTEKGLGPGIGGEETLRKWMNWRRGEDFVVERGGLVVVDKKSKL